MNWTWIVIFVIGLAIGTGLVWWLYARDLEQKLKTAVANQAKLKQQLAQKEKSPDSVPLRAELNQLRATHTQIQDELATAEVKISDLQNKFKRLDSEAEKLRLENKTLRANLVTAVNEAKRLQDSLTQARQQAADLQTEKGQISQRLALAEAEFKQWQKYGGDSEKIPLATTAVGSPPSGDLGQQLKTTETYIASLKEQINSLKKQHEETQHLQQQLAIAQNTLHTANTEINSLQTLLTYSQEDPDSEQVDMLRNIKGIGPTFALKLYEGGIRTFDQLAQMTPDEIIEIIEINAPNIDEWLQQAREWAGEK